MRIAALKASVTGGVAPANRIPANPTSERNRTAFAIIVPVKNCPVARYTVTNTPCGIDRRNAPPMNSRTPRSDPLKGTPRPGRESEGWQRTAERSRKEERAMTEKRETPSDSRRRKPASSPSTWSNARRFPM